MAEPPKPTPAGRAMAPALPGRVARGLADEPPGPDARYERRGARARVRGGPPTPAPRQRAVLVLRDVLGFRAAEVAEMLETSESVGQGALQRARASARRAPARRRSRARAAARLACANASSSAASPTRSSPATSTRVVALLTDDAWLTMPPEPYEYQGARAIARFLASAGTVAARHFRLVPTRANGQPAFGCYLPAPRHRIARAYGLLVLTLQTSGIVAITWFGDSSLFPHFGLPRTLP